MKKAAFLLIALLFFMGCIYNHSVAALNQYILFISCCAFLLRNKLTIKTLYSISSGSLPVKTVDLPGYFTVVENNIIYSRKIC